MKRKNYHDKKLSSKLKEYLIRVFQRVKEEKLVVFLIRDFEKLPEYCGFDLDIAYSHAHEKKMREIFRVEALKLELRVFYKDKLDGFFKKAVFDLDCDQGERGWLLLDFQPEIRSLKKTFHPEEITFEFARINDFDLPVPGVEWNFLLLFSNSETKGKIAQKKEKLLKLCEELPAQSFVFKKLETDKNILVKKLETSTDDIKTAEYSTVPFGLRSLVAEIFFKYLFFIHIHNPLLFSINGADGAGKTTIAEIVREKLECLPLPFEFVHPVRKVKDERQAAFENKTVSSGSGETATFPDPLKSLRKRIWRVIPVPLKNIYSSIIGEMGYAGIFNDVTFNAYSRGKVMLFDRYMPDHTMRVMLQGAKFHYAISNFFSARLIRKPVHMFIITDTPENIYERKPELEKNHIDMYQKEMRKFCRKNNFPNTEISVTNTPPVMAAGRITEKILQLIGDEKIISLMGVWEKN
jgi:hypothetical protein